MQVRVGISKRHVHLTEETYVKLFGNNNIKVRNELMQKGEFASESSVTIKNGDRKIENVRIVGPFREYNQVEIARSDAQVLGVNPPVRSSGDLSDALNIVLVGPMGEVNLNNALIISKRHMHISPEEAKNLSLKNNQKITINKEGIPLEVYVKYTEGGVLEIHIDNDEALEYGLETGDMVNL